MGLLDHVERGIERAVRSAFSGRGGSLGPVEIATAVRRHIDSESRMVSSGQTLVPNLFTIRLAEENFAEAKKYGTSLAEELCQEIIRHADSQGYTLAGPVKASFLRNSELKNGQMSIESRVDRSVSADAASRHQGVPTATAALPAGRFPAEPQPAPTPLATARLDYQGQVFTLREPITVIGRSSAADVTVNDSGASRQHVEVHRRGSRWFARDLGSTNGSYVDGMELRQAETELYDGALISLGGARLRFHLG